MTTSELRPELDDLRTRVSGKVTGPLDPGYDEARAVWNGMIDRRPWAVVRAAGGRDVAPTIGFAREHGLPLAVRGGGHNVAGNGTVDAGLVLDLGNLHAVSVDPAAAIVRVEAGATLATSTRPPRRTGSSCRSAWCPAPASPDSPSAAASAG